MELQNALNQLQISYSELEQLKSKLEESPEMYNENAIESKLEDMEAIMAQMQECIDSIRDSFE
ncbi:hypothetical protein [Lyngbya sp. PCC 8106]|uniref:hypothetical protein n=1 Tax=Lyngbya sp. (strain PCC 8106) TaxID=313612 RepID=UPI0000EA9942|nr:hypothetical protein [Lyngbya sp. PCC 8106]EAW35213.1 hypothetical protein L8106_13900 [Lyngbya sp. PCC 8106]